MPFDAEHLYNLLPSVYRVRDAEQGGPLRELVSTMAGVVAASIEEDLAQLYDDQFIETCAGWVVPYIGDLIGYRTLYGVAPEVSSPRAEVANTMTYRRRRGTAAILEQLARDVTGWDARVVEFFQLLATTQHLQHVRPGNLAIADLRDPVALEKIGTPFDPLARTVDVRRIASGRGRYNIPNVGIFLWRLGAHRFSDVPVLPVNGDARRYRFDPIGVDRPLYSNPQREPDISHLAHRINVPMPLTYLETAPNLPAYWGNSFSVAYDGSTPDVDSRVRICNLTDDPATPGGWAHMPAVADGDPEIAIDPVLGRLAVRDDLAPSDVRVTFHSAFSAEMGGGEYEREPTFDDALASDPLTPKEIVSHLPGPNAPHTTIASAFAALAGKSGIIEVDDSWRFALPDLDLAEKQRVELRAANERRPILEPDAGSSLNGAGGSQLILNGFLITTQPLRVTGGLDALTIRHCTLVPGLSLTSQGEPVAPNAPSIEIDPAPENLAFSLELSQSISGPIRVPETQKPTAAQVTPGLRCIVTLRESIVDAGGRRQRAARTPALVGDTLNPFPAAFPLARRLLVTIGADGPHEIALAGPLADINGAAASLETAIRAAAPGPAFDEMRVLAHGDRLVLVSGIAERVVIAQAGLDQTATLLGLTPDHARRVSGLLSAPLTPETTLNGATPTVSVTLNQVREDVAGLPTTASDRTTLRAALEAAVKGASVDPAFADAAVLLLDEQLLILPGSGEDAPLFGPTDTDDTTVHELGLSTRPAVGAGSGGERPGPVMTIDRSTLIGPVYVAAIELATDSIFLDQLVSERRQSGCVRFSYLPPGSRTPWRFRCQPSSGAPSRRVRPAFTSLRFHDPAYCQLAPGCPVEISRGAADEAEMGVFHDLFQPQRLTNLQIRLEEYLRLGLEAGIIFAS